MNRRLASFAIGLSCVLGLSIIVFGAVNIRHNAVEIDPGPIVVPPGLYNIEIHACCSDCTGDGKLNWEVESDPYEYFVDPRARYVRQDHLIGARGKSGVQHISRSIEATCPDHGSKQVPYQVTAVNETLNWGIDDDNYQAVNGTLSVRQGGTLYFQALPDPTENSFPADMLVWGGTSGIPPNQGTSEVNHTFNTKSTSLGDQTVTVRFPSFEPVATANVTVWTLSEQLMLKGCDDAWKTYAPEFWVVGNLPKTLQFKAITDPDGADFGSNVPTWVVAGTGITADPSTGAVTTVTLSSYSTDIPDVKTVQAQLGDSYTVEARGYVVPDFMVRWSCDGGQSWSDSDTIKVVKGSTLQFFCCAMVGQAYGGMVPDWGGTANPEGSGSVVSVAFDTVSTSGTDYKTVTATVDCITKTKNVLVIDVGLEAVGAGNYPDLSPGNLCINAQPEYNKARWKALISPSSEEARVWIGDGYFAQCDKIVSNNEEFDVESAGHAGIYELRISPSGFPETYKQETGTAFRFKLLRSDEEGDLLQKKEVEYPMTYETGSHKHTHDEAVYTENISIYTEPSQLYDGTVSASITATVTCSGELTIARDENAQAVDLSDLIVQVAGFPDLNVSTLFGASAVLQVRTQVHLSGKTDEERIDNFAFSVLYRNVEPATETSHTANGLVFTLSEGTTKNVKVMRQVGIAAAHNACWVSSKATVDGASLDVEGFNYAITE